MGLIDELPWMKLVADNIQSRSTRSGFGTVFPQDAEKGDTFVRVDVLPNQLFKFNGSKWIEIDKSQSDHYTYNEAYIDHLIEKIHSGEYDPEFLSAAETAQIEHRLQQRS